MDFPLYFQKVIWPGGDCFYYQKKILKKPNTSEYAQVLVVTWAKLNSVTALLPHSPYNAQWTCSPTNPQA